MKSLAIMEKEVSKMASTVPDETYEEIIIKEEDSAEVPPVAIEEILLDEENTQDEPTIDEIPEESNTPATPLCRHTRSSDDTPLLNPMHEDPKKFAKKMATSNLTNSIDCISYGAYTIIVRYNEDNTLNFSFQ
jgi:hypothetical protein